MTRSKQRAGVVFRVLDAYEAPHGGVILKLRLEDGEAPSIRSLKGTRMVATSPDGDQRNITIEGFAVFGGRPTDERLARTGRIDVHGVLDAPEEPLPITPEWELSGPLPK